MDPDYNVMIQCPNCETEFDTKYEYCPHCGQRNKKLELRFKHLFHDFIGSAFNLDSKLFRTLKLLIFSPGELSKLFLQGKRTMFVPPVRLYLIISLVYFTLLSFVGGDFVRWTDDGDQDVAALDSITGSNGLIKDAVYSADTNDTSRLHDIDTSDNPAGLEQLIPGNNDSIEDIDDGKLKKTVNDKLRKLGTEEGKASFQDLMRNYMNIGMFVLMPVTALIFFMLFYRETFYIQHLVFVLHLQSMMYILFIFLNLIELMISNTFVDILNVVLFLFILLIWVKRFYIISWGKTIWKSLLFLALYSISFAIFIAVIIIVSAFNL
jgi:hypothetical protein